MKKASEKTYAQQFMEVFNSLCRKLSKWQVWADFIVITACSISNSIDRTMFVQREQRYMQAIQNYTKDEVDRMANLVALIALALEENPKQDFLGDIYSSLGFLNKKIGQIFTPYRLAELMAKTQCGDWAEQIKRKGFISINDPCCGAGVMLIAAANTAQEKGISYQHSVVFVAQDIDFTTAMMCYIQLSLLGCVGYVGVGNTLTEPCPSRENTWYMPMNTLRSSLLERFYQGNICSEESEG